MAAQPRFESRGARRTGVDPAEPQEMEARFYGPLEFGTAGLRGTMAVGLHNMNVHVIRWATQGFADIICAEGEAGKRRGVAICMDCRNHSMDFARAAAEVCAANGIHVRIFEALRPTPELSFAVREYGCQAGINITASHNPKEYNGYKVYWEDGAQLPPQHADAVAKRLSEIDVFTDIRTMPYDEAVKAGFIETLGAETDEKFLTQVMGQANDPETVAKVADTFKVVYTPFHGTGYQLIPGPCGVSASVSSSACRSRWSLTETFPPWSLPTQKIRRALPWQWTLPSGRGLTSSWVPTPMPTGWASWSAPRAGEFQVISGNQTGVLLLDYLIGARRRSGRMPENPWPSKRLSPRRWPGRWQRSTAFSAMIPSPALNFWPRRRTSWKLPEWARSFSPMRESYGYMLGDYVRDKDAVTASLLLTEMAAWYASQGLTLADAMESLYEKYGYYAEHTYNLVMPGLDGLRDMAKLMKSLGASSGGALRRGCHSSEGLLGRQVRGLRLRRGVRHGALRLQRAAL